MVDWFGQWYEEEDYSKYPKEKWCDYDHMAVWIREQGYNPKTDIEHLITMIFSHYDDELEENDMEFTIEGCKEFVINSGGLSEFDYHC